MALPTSTTTIPSCGYCHHTIKNLQAQLQYRPHLSHKIHEIQQFHQHTTRDDDNILICPLLKSHYCSKCKAYGHTISRCSPCEYCTELGHNDRECPIKRKDDRLKAITLVLQITKKVGFETNLLKLQQFCKDHDIDIIKTY